MLYKIAKVSYFYSYPLQVVSILEESYDSVKEAIKVITEYDTTTYYLSVGEACRPDYYIVTNEVANYIKSGRNGDISKYNWSQAECVCTECKHCKDMMNNQDVDYIIKNSL